MDPVTNKALLVLVVGMITVFVILSLVVITGQTLIKIVNRFFPGELKLSSPKMKTAPVFEDFHGKPQSKMVAIISAVEAVTQGKGRITSIEKL